MAYALEALADLMNDPTSPFRPDCTSVGNSWLHRLGIYLLHHCSVEGLPPDPSLVRVMSLVALPPSASIKSGKATRIHDYLSNSEYPRYLHYASAAQAVGKALALELLDELDANRQTEHFRRIERAVAFYAVQLINGATEPSIKSIEVASGLSWADARKLVQRPYFKRLVFQHQCRHLAAHPESDCAECASLRAEEAESRVYESSLSKVI